MLLAAAPRGGPVAIGVVLTVILAAIVGILAVRRGRPFVGWFLFGFVCFLPALIIVLLCTDKEVKGPRPAPRAVAGLGPPPAAGWYADPGGGRGQRYWDGQAWGSETR